MCLKMIIQERNEIDEWNLACGPYTKIVDMYQLLDQIGQPEIVLNTYSIFFI